MENKIIRNKIKKLVELSVSYNRIEEEYIKDVGDWISDSKNIFRIQKDAIPPKHLVSYAIVVDFSLKKVLLFNHKKAQLMLPSGGHIERNEMPLVAARRELKEELGLSLNMHKLPDKKVEVPFFVTVTKTVGISSPHTDVSLWYLFEEDSTKFFEFSGDEYNKEFDNFHWVSFDKILLSPIEKFDKHMHRVIKKMDKYVVESK